MLLFPHISHEKNWGLESLSSWLRRFKARLVWLQKPCAANHQTILLWEAERSKITEILGAPASSPIIGQNTIPVYSPYIYVTLYSLQSFSHFNPYSYSVKPKESLPPFYRQRNQSQATLLGISESWHRWNPFKMVSSDAWASSWHYLDANLLRTECVVSPAAGMEMALSGLGIHVPSGCLPCASQPWPPSHATHVLGHTCLHLCPGDSFLACSHQLLWP